MDVNLTQGATVRICGNNFGRDDEFKPVLQFTDCQNHVLGQNQGLSLSDGSHFSTAILFTQLQELVHSRRLQKGSIVKLARFFVDKLENRKVMIIVDLDVILEECEPIGELPPLSIYAP